MRCPRCGNENPEQNRFCGMCGTTLLEPATTLRGPQPVPVSVTPEAALVRPTEPERTAAPVSDEAPLISGPSFLGLNNPPPAKAKPRKRASLSIDPHNAPTSGSLDYLLEDEEEPKHSGAWKYVLFLVALALAVGFGYLRWRNEGLAWLNPSGKKPVAAVDDSGASKSAGPTPSTATSSSSAATPDAQPATTPVSTPPANVTPPPAATAATTSTSANPAAGAPTAAPASANTAGPGDSTKPSDGANPIPAADKGSLASGKGAAGEAAAATNDTGDQPPDKALQPAAKPRAAVPAADPVSEARKYLYGRGVAQDCDRGMRLLKPAANQSNTKAMVEMGALYSAGLCTPHDLPTAYRWFALASRKEPDNTAIQSDLQKLWSEMTQPERQLAIKLSQ